MKREELLTMADEQLTFLFRHTKLATEEISARSNLAQACVMLAKELREGEMPPYEVVMR